MRNKNYNKFIGLLSGMALISMVSCQSDPLSPGVEYMPDMYRTPAYGTYVNYNNSDSSVSRKPVEGTIVYSYNSENINLNNLPYPFEKTTEGYEKAGQVLKNPLAKTDLVLAEGKELYGKFCIHCHGENGQGDGSLVKNDKYPAPPNYTTTLSDLPEGKIFHSIHYGKGLMGSHASQISKIDRWKIVHYVQKLQKPNQE